MCASDKLCCLHLSFLLTSRCAVLPSGFISPCAYSVRSLTIALVLLLSSLSWLTVLLSHLPTSSPFTTFRSCISTFFLFSLNCAPLLDCIFFTDGVVFVFLYFVVHYGSHDACVCQSMGWDRSGSG